MCTGLRGVAYWVVREKVTRTREREKSSTSAFSCCSSASARKFLYSVDARTHRHTHNSSLKRNNFLFLPSCRWSRFQPRNSHTRARLPFFFPPCVSFACDCYLFLVLLCYCCLGDSSGNTSFVRPRTFVSFPDLAIFALRVWNPIRLAMKRELEERSCYESMALFVSFEE